MYPARTAGVSYVQLVLLLRFDPLSYVDISDSIYSDSRHSIGPLINAAAAAFALLSYVDISDSIYPDRYPVLVQQEQVVKVRALAAAAAAAV
jgi:hypothetical protein